ncbi:hypothetical protein NXS19_003203 [Fusarium pseudograminearum]|nr:hypothetical protein NXS19_003203 [Fusarium pseudograminearum]
MALGPGGVLEFFLREKGLNWIEAMCLLQVLPDALRVVYKLRRLATATEPRVHSSSQETRRGAQDLIHNIFRMMCYFRIGIESAPLQIYASGLTFCPEIFLESMSKKRSDAQDEVYTWKTSSLNLPSHWSPVTPIFSFSFPINRFSNVYLAPTQDDFIISSCRRDTLILQRTNNAAPAELLSHACDVVLGAYSTDHTRLACLSSEGKIVIWDMEREQVLKTLDINVHGFPKPEKLDKGALTFTSDISTLLLAYHGRIGMWNIDRESFSQPFDIGSYSVTKCHVFGREGTLLATVETGVVEIWNLGDNHMIQQYTNQNLVKVTHRIPIAFSHDGYKFVVIEVGRVVVHDLEDGKDLCIDTDAMGFQTCIAAPVFTRTGNIGVPCENGIHLLAANGTHLGTFDVKAHGGFCFSADELQIAAVVSQYFSACEIGIWDADLLSTKTDEDVEQWDYTPDCFISNNGCQLALVSPDKISIRNTHSGLLEKSFKTLGLLSVRFSKDFRWFAWKKHGDNVLRFWDTLKDEIAMEIDLGESLCIDTQVFFSHPDLNLVAIWPLNGEITIWDLLSRSPRSHVSSAEIRQHYIFNHDGEELVFSLLTDEVFLSNAKNGIEAYDTRTGALTRTFKLPYPLLSTLALSEDGLRLVVNQCTIRGDCVVLDVKTGSCLTHVYDCQFTVRLTDQRIRTQYGILDLRNRILMDMNSSEFEDDRFRIAVNKQEPDDYWIMCGNRKVIWIPYDFRAGMLRGTGLRHPKSTKNTMVFTNHIRGGVVWLRFL